VPLPRPASPGTATSGEAPNQAAEIELNVDRIAARMKLQATYIQGDRRLAVINGRLYNQGDQMPVSGSPAESCQVKKISAYSVVIGYRGRAAEVGYPGLAHRRGETSAPGQTP
jgi:hypothetical protein